MSASLCANWASVGPSEAAAAGRARMRSATSTIFAMFLRGAAA